MIRLFLICAAVMIFTVPAMAAGRFASRTTPSIADFSFGPHERNVMDIYIPPGAKDAPIILMAHGGGWRRGDKDMPGVVDRKAERWVPAGFIIVSTNYPLLPDDPVIRQAEGVGLAIAATQKYARKWGGDPSRVILMGHSAGAHLVAMVNANPDIAYSLGASPWLGAVSIDGAALDIRTLMTTKHYDLHEDAFGLDPAAWDAVSPFALLGKKSLPWLGICSIQRDMACEQAESMHAKAAALGLKSAVISQDLSHGDINSELGRPGPYTSAVESFMASLDPVVRSRLSALPVSASGDDNWANTPEHGPLREAIRKRIMERRSGSGINP